MNIILFGFKNCGKTLVGKALAKEIGWEFVDSDRIVEEIYFEKNNKKISFREIAKNHGMDFFREVEKEAVERIAGLDQNVISLGGGVPLFFENTISLKKNGKMILLKLNKEILFKRIMHKSIPAFFDPKDPHASFEKLFKERMQKFDEIADFEIDCYNKSTKKIAGEIIQLLGIT